MPRVSDIGWVSALRVSFSSSRVLASALFTTTRATVASSQATSASTAAGMMVRANEDNGPEMPSMCIIPSAPISATSRIAQNTMREMIFSMSTFDRVCAARRSLAPIACAARRARPAATSATIQPISRTANPPRMLGRWGPKESCRDSCHV